MKDSQYSVSQLKERTGEELYGLMAELKRNLFDHRVMQATSQLKDHNSIKRTKKNVARIMTEINRRKNAG
ncbi:MAG: 50S ribosomal protein L29 [Deltaproteobacteria bacterium]|jgi:ribosomal protein L29|nr:50S ribosomal protein L29 [Deltaproteobacteria bacterium]